MEIMTKKVAREKNMHKYYTGKLCKNGHHDLRYALTGACVSCIAVYGKARYQHPGEHLVKVWAHEDDIDTIKNMAGALRLARKL